MYDSPMMKVLLAVEQDTIKNNPDHKISNEMAISTMLMGMEVAVTANDVKGMQATRKLIEAPFAATAFTKDELMLLKSAYTYHKRLMNWRLKLIKQSKE